jgi:hypothetical protein
MKKIILFIIFILTNSVFLYARNKKPIIKIINGRKSISALKKSSANDKGIRQIEISFALSGKPTKDVTIKLSIKTNTTKSQPALLSQSVTIPRKSFSTGLFTIKDSIQLKSIDCLTDTEKIEIITEEDPNANSYEIDINPISSMSISNINLLNGESIIQPFVKNGDIKNEIQAIQIQLRLNGHQPEKDTAFDVEIPLYQSNRILSNPIIEYGHINIPKTKFDSSGCETIFPWPLLIKLKQVDSLSNNEVADIISKNTNDTSSHLLIILRGTNDKPISQKKPMIRDSTYRPYNFTYPCSNGKNFSVVLTEDTLYVQAEGENRKYGCKYNNYFRPIDFQTWLTNIFGDKIRSGNCNVCFGCAFDLANKISNELTFITNAKKIKSKQSKKSEEVQDSSMLNMAKTASVLNDSIKSKKNESLSIHLDNKATVLNPIYIKDSVRYESMNLIFIADSLPKENDTVNLTVDRKLFPYTPEIRSKTGQQLVLIKNKWNPNDVLITGDTSTSKYYQKVSISIQNQSIDSLHYDNFAYIQIKGGDSSFHAINLTEKGMYKNRPFWMETGSNFDLLDGVKAQNLYAGIYMFEKDIASIFCKKNNLGFTGGVYESKSTSISTSSDSGLIYRDGTSFLFDSAGPSPNLQGYRYYRDTGSFTTTTNVQSIGILFSPHLRLDRRRADDNGFHVFASAYFEMLWQRVTSSFDYSKTGRDTTYFASSPAEVAKQNYKESSLNADYRSQYIGLGLPFYLTESNAFTLYINDVFGVCNQQFSAIQANRPFNTKDSSNYLLKNNQLDNTFVETKKSWNPFYLLQFRLTEGTYGIVFAGEVRGLLLQDAKPVISLSLSKKFDLGELVKTIVKPFTPGSQ